MAFTVFFREENEIFPANAYIPAQLKDHRETLQTMADALSKNGILDYPTATKNNNGDWWVMLKAENGDLYTYSIFVSRFEQSETGEIKTGQPPEKKELVIIDPGGPKDSIGGYHPGYWTVAHYASLLEEKQRAVFLNTIHHIEHNIPSGFYTFNDDGTIAIHINRQEKAYAIIIECRAEWK